VGARVIRLKHKDEELRKKETLTGEALAAFSFKMFMMMTERGEGMKMKKKDKEAIQLMGQRPLSFVPRCRVCSSAPFFLRARNRTGGRERKGIPSISSAKPPICITCTFVSFFLAHIACVRSGGCVGV
jgi:hypothetical protein